MNKLLFVCLCSSILMHTACEDKDLLENWSHQDGVPSMQIDMADDAAMKIIQWSTDFSDGQFVDSSSDYSYWYSNFSYWKLSHHGEFNGKVFIPTQHVYKISSFVICNRHNGGECKSPVSITDKNSLSYLGFDTVAEPETARVYFGRSIPTIKHLTVNYSLIDVKTQYIITLKGRTTSSSEVEISSISVPSADCPNSATCSKKFTMATLDPFIGLSIEVYPTAKGYGWLNINSISVEGKEVL